MAGRGRSRKKPEAWTRIARERMQILFDQAEAAFEKHPERSKRYVELARKIGMRYNVRPEGMRTKYCRKCSALLRPGVNSRIRLRKDRQAVVTTCLSCGSVSRHPYIREKKIIKQRREKGRKE
jgi:ribonuclease P protein subunit RPR2